MLVMRIQNAFSALVLKTSIAFANLIQNFTIFFNHLKSYANKNKSLFKIIATNTKIIELICSNLITS